MIFVQNVTKKFDSLIAVNNLSFKAKPGEIIGFLGPNGAGKTTTMRLLLGYLVPTEGRIEINNFDPNNNRIHLMKDVGYLPENNPLYLEMKVQEYLQFIAEIKNADEFETIAEEVGLNEVMDKKIEELSRGFKQRVGLGAALLGKPSLLILDEPTSGLDPLEQDKIKQLIKKIAKNKTILFSTHILSEAEDIASRLIIMHKGLIVYDGKKPSGKGGVEKLFRKLVK
ncbi:MAG: ABC transporter ATP-binding protein [bacterium]|nr:ABC transporter ATP-binding protein [bacterium]